MCWVLENIQKRNCIQFKYSKVALIFLECGPIYLNIFYNKLCYLFWKYFFLLIYKIYGNVKLHFGNHNPLSHSVKLVGSYRKNWKKNISVVLESNVCFYVGASTQSRFKNSFLLWFWSQTFWTVVRNQSAINFSY